MRSLRITSLFLTKVGVKTPGLQNLHISSNSFCLIYSLRNLRVLLLEQPLPPLMSKSKSKTVLKSPAMILRALPILSIMSKVLTKKSTFILIWCVNRGNSIKSLLHCYSNNYKSPFNISLVQ